MTGSRDTRLILIRGNSASEKSSLAHAIRAARPRGVAIVGQDQLRREILHAREEPGNPTIGYLDLSVRYALDVGLHVVVEGILDSRIYGAMLTQLLEDHRGITRCYRLGLLLLDAWAPFFSEVAQEIEEDALRQGWQVQIANSARSEDRERLQLEGFEARRVSGLIVVPQGDVGPRLDRLTRSGTACVLLDPAQERPLSSLVPSVGVDHRTGGRLAGRRLLDHGCRRIGFVGDAHKSRASRERLEGLRDVLYGRPVTVIETEDLGLGYGTHAAVEVLCLPVAERPDGLFVGNDITAIGLVHALLVGGVSVPDDVAVVGYDDISMADQVAVPLTTVRQPIPTLAAAATRMVTSPSEEDDIHVLLEPTLVVRASA